MYEAAQQAKQDDGRLGAFRQGAIMGGGLASGNLAARVSEVPHEMDALDRNTTAMWAVIEQLEQRLGPITRGEVNQTLAGGIKEQIAPVPNTPLGAQIHENNSRIVTQRTRLESLLARLEV